MKVDVALFSHFQKGRFLKKGILLPDDSNVNDLLDYLKINNDEVGIIIVNNKGITKDATFDYIIKTGDVLTLIPVIGGG